MPNRFFFVLFLLPVLTHAQKLKKSDRQIVNNLQHHIQYLADDKLEGRRAGSPGEKIAYAYIGNEFKQIGLQPKGTDDYIQTFESDEGKEIGPSTYFSIDGNELRLGKDYYPLPYSPNKTLEALPSIALRENDMPWFYDLKELLEENQGNPHFDLSHALFERAKEFAKKGATALFVYNTSGTEDGLEFDGHDLTKTIAIPVVYVSKEAAGKYFHDLSAALDIKLKIEIQEKRRTISNVIGYIDNGAPSVVIVGAHYDHLGYGEDGHTLGGKGQIYNGADDNASGTAALIELARMVKNSKLKNNNYLFIAFSGEELGLLGSKYFTEHPTIDLNRVNYMINMDMVGRLNDSSHALTVGGYGTSATWGTLYHQSGRHRLYADDLSFRFDSSGIGPSDHTSFYLKNIPVLFYFTGIHADYHKPTDDYDKINYAGEVQVIKHIFSLIETEDKQKNRVVFSKTRDPQFLTSARFSVTLGIMPDYSFNGTGVRIDGISENRPAQKAGLQIGDVILALGENKVGSLESYMQALGKFHKGDKTKVTFSRSNQIRSSVVEF